MTRWLFSIILAVCFVVANGGLECRAADQAVKAKPATAEKVGDLKPLNKNETVLLDAKEKKTAASIGSGDARGVA